MHQFLYGFDERLFQTVRSNLTTRVPLPTLEEAYNAVKQEKDIQHNNRIREDNQKLQHLQFRPRLDLKLTIPQQCASIAIGLGIHPRATSP